MAANDKPAGQKPDHPVLPASFGKWERWVLRAMLYYVVAAGFTRLPMGGTLSNGDLSRDAATLAVCTVVAIAGLACSSKGGRT